MRWLKLGELHPRRFFLQTWVALDEEAAMDREHRARAGPKYDYWPLIAFASGAAFLTTMDIQYLGGTRGYEAAIDTFELYSAYLSPFSRLFEFAWWAGWRVLGYFVFPAILLKVMGQKLRDHGLSTSGFSEHVWIYGVFYTVVLTAVVIVSFFSDFSSYYPFYKLANRSWFDFIAWELLYAAQFFALEFFFRGFWLKACRVALGSKAIFAMVVPYCMIHFGKPMLEAFAAIVAGIVLGTLAMKTRSIWSGFLIHVSVAISMDVAALLQTTGMPERWWPVVLG